MQTYKRYGLILFLSIVLNVLQQGIFSGIQIFGVSMDIVFVVIVCYSLIREDIECVILALICGLIRDSFFQDIFGLNTIVYVLTAYILCHIEKSIYKDAILIPMISTFVFTAFKEILYYGYLYAASIRFDIVEQLMYLIPIEALQNSILSIIIFRFVSKINTLKCMHQEWKF
ncbi:MAG: rod shape-determining protein MreD [Clostridium sp.]